MTNTTKTQYAVVNTAYNSMVGQLTEDKEEARRTAAEFNAAMNPEYQTYTVATVTFDPEI